MGRIETIRGDSLFTTWLINLLCSYANPLSTGPPQLVKRMLSVTHGAGRNGGSHQVPAPFRSGALGGAKAEPASDPQATELLLIKLPV